MQWRTHNLVTTKAHTNIVLSRSPVSLFSLSVDAFLLYVSQISDPPGLLNEGVKIAQLAAAGMVAGLVNQGALSAIGVEPGDPPELALEVQARPLALLGMANLAKFA